VPTECTGAGDCLRAEKVIAEARQVGAIRVVRGSGKHRRSHLDLRDSVYCVIAIPLRAIANKAQ
jgi:hypothetical protein